MLECENPEQRARHQAFAREPFLSLLAQLAAARQLGVVRAVGQETAGDDHPGVVGGEPARENRTSDASTRPRSARGSVWPNGSISRVAEPVAESLRPASETTAGVMTSDARITTRTALIVCLSKNPSLAPTSVVASVAAACEPEKPDITPISGQLNPSALPDDDRRQCLAAEDGNREHQRVRGASSGATSTSGREGCRPKRGRSA